MKFLESFYLSFNEKKHWGNEKESLKIIEDIIVPYVTKQRKKLSSPNQPALLIMDVFKGQMTNPVLKKLEEHNILLIRVLGNMTHLFQPLNLTFNGNFKQLIKQKFVEWHANKVTRALDDGQDLESITIDFKLSTVKPLDAKWVMEAYNHMTPCIGKDICLEGCKKSGIQEALENGLEHNSDPFKDIDPIETADEVSYNLFVINKMCINQQNLDGNYSDWEDDDGNIFNIFIELLIFF